MQSEIIKRHIERHMRFKPNEITRDARFIRVFNEGFTALGLFDFTRTRKQLIEIPIFGDELSGRLDADPRHARHIVNRVPRERLNINNTFGWHPKFLNDFIRADAFVFHRIVKRHTIANELHQILVRGDNGCGGTCLGGKPRIGRNQIIRLIVLLFDGRYFKSSYGVTDEFELRAQFLRRFGTVGLVIGVKPVAKGLGRMVKNHRKMGGPLARNRIPQQLPEHVAKTRHSSDRQPVGFARQRRQSVKSAENIARPVHQKHVVAAFDF